jgi:hypothetical protein
MMMCFFTRVRDRIYSLKFIKIGEGHLKMFLRSSSIDELDLFSSPIWYLNFFSLIDGMNDFHR